RFAVHFDVGYDVNLRQALDEPAACFLNGRPIEIPQAAAEGDQLLITEALVADQHDRMLVPRLQQPHKRGLAELPEIDAPHLGAERLPGRDQLDSSGSMAFRWLCNGQRHLAPPYT